MRDLLVIVFACALLVSGAYFQNNLIPVANASDFSSYYSGDLILNGSNVTVIEGWFGINGSIIVEENATLVLRNAVVDFTTVSGIRFNMTFRNPSNGNPRLLIENATLRAEGYTLYLYFYGNSSALMSMLAASQVELNFYESSVASIENSTIYRIGVGGNCSINLSDSLLLFDIGVYDSSNVTISSCTIGSLHAEGGHIDVSNSSITYHVAPRAYSANLTVNGLQPGFFNYWSFRVNCSVAVAPGGKASNIVFRNTQINGWILYLWRFSNATISQSHLKDVFLYNSASALVYGSFCSKVYAFHTSALRINNSIADSLFSYGSSKLRLMNTRTSTHGSYDQSEVFVLWYLDVHVKDSDGNDVQMANVTAAFSNSTIAKSALTDANGYARLELLEKKINASGEHPVGNYSIQANSEGCTDRVMVSLTESGEVTLSLVCSVMPDYTLLLVALLIMIIAFSAFMLWRRKRRSSVPAAERLKKHVR